MLAQATIMHHRALSCSIAAEVRLYAFSAAIVYIGLVAMSKPVLAFLRNHHPFKTLPTHQRRYWLALWQRAPGWALPAQ